MNRRWRSSREYASRLVIIVDNLYSLGSSIDTIRHHVDCFCMFTREEINAWAWAGDAITDESGLDLGGEDQ